MACRGLGHPPNSRLLILKTREGTLWGYELTLAHWKRSLIMPREPNLDHFLSLKLILFLIQNYTVIPAFWGPTCISPCSVFNLSLRYLSTLFIFFSSICPFINHSNINSKYVPFFWQSKIKPLQILIKIQYSIQIINYLKPLQLGWSKDRQHGCKIDMIWHLLTLIICCQITMIL